MIFLKKHLDVLLACGFYSVSLLVLQSMLNLQANSWLACSIGVTWIIGRKLLKKPLFLDIGTFFTVILAICLFYKPLLKASSSLIHQVLGKLAIEQNIIFSSILSEQSSYVDYWSGVVFGIVSLPMAMLMSYLFEKKNIKGMVAWVLIIWIIQLLMGWTATFNYNVLLGWVLVIAVVFHLHSLSMFLQKSSVLSGIIVIAFFVSIFTNITEHYQVPASLANFRETVNQAIYETRYEKNKTNSYSEGKFQGLGPLELNKSEALRVVMEQPQPLYLKGFVGTMYTKNQWETLNGELAFTSKPLLNALSNSGFNPVTQLNNVVNRVQLPNNSQSKVKIQNINANSQYIYTPYELASMPNEASTHKDSTSVATLSLFGERQYQYEIMSTDVAKYPQIANALYTLKSQDSLQEYIFQESHYNEYVYEHFLQIPDETKQLLENHLEDRNLIFPNRPSYEKGIDAVKKFVATELTYSEEVKAKDAKEDFLSYVLETRREGYAAHFATVATMVFRYYGIPARYVEGYLITPDDVEDKQDFSEVQVMGENAHAWPEIYIDLVGWVPIEVTPPYLTKMPSIDLSDYPKGASFTQKTDNSQSQTEGETSKKEVKDDEQHMEPTSDKYERSLGIWIVISLCILMVVCILILLRLLYTKHKQKRLFRSANNKVAITQLFAYTMSLLEKDGMRQQGGSIYHYTDYIEVKYGEICAQHFNNAVEVQQQVLYSQQEPVNEQREIVLVFKNEIKKAIAKQKPYLIGTLYYYIR